MTKRIEVVPDENFEVEVSAQMTIPLVTFNTYQYEGYLREGDLDDFHKEPGIKRLLLLVSILEQKQDRLIVEAEWSNRHLRKLEAQIIRMRLSNDAVNKIDLRKVVYEILKIAGAAIVGGLIAGKLVFK